MQSRQSKRYELRTVVHSGIEVQSQAVLEEWQKILEW
jgi:hypothetical protein